MRICLAGEGAQGISHADVLQDIEGVEIVTLAGGIAADAEAFAYERGIPHWSLDLEECLSRDGVEAVILTTPNQVHCAQTELALNMGKHVLVEIPMGISLAESQRIAALEERTGLVCMVCHTQRYNSAFREVYRQVQEGELTLHHIVQQTYFFRRRNENRFGKKRTWVDALLWHQACHMVDMCYWLLDDPDMEGWGQAGPLHAELGVPMDISIGMRTKDGKLVTSANSFNNYGPIYSEYRFSAEGEVDRSRRTGDRATGRWGDRRAGPRVLRIDKSGATAVDQLPGLSADDGDSRPYPAVDRRLSGDFEQSVLAGEGVALA